jgi:hypothetical protein
MSVADFILMPILFARPDHCFGHQERRRLAVQSKNMRESQCKKGTISRDERAYEWASLEPKKTQPSMPQTQANI